MQQATGIGFTQSVPTCLALAMPGIIQDEQQLVKKNLLGFQLADTMLIDILAHIAVIPVEANNFLQNNYDTFNLGIN